MISERSTENERWIAIKPPSIMGVCSNSSCGVSESKNETLAAFVSNDDDNKKGRSRTTVVKSSEYLRRILIEQDFGGSRKRLNGKRVAAATTRRQNQDPSSISSLNRRKLKVVEGFGGKVKKSLLSKAFDSRFSSPGSVSSLSSMSTFGRVESSDSFNLINNIHKTNTTNKYYNKRTQSPTPTQRSPTTRNNNRNSLSRYNNMDSATSFGSISNNNRWNSSPPISVPVQKRRIGHGTNKSNDDIYNTTVTSLTHQRQRWQATSANQHESDRPIGVSPVVRKLSATALFSILSTS